MDGKGYFLDSYAFIEYVAGNTNYVPYFETNILQTSTFNIVEIYYKLLLISDEKTADEKTIPLFPFVLPATPLSIKEAMKFKLKHKKKKLSYADCIGYTLAKENNLKFLTGDKEFKDLPNVEYVK